MKAAKILLVVACLVTSVSTLGQGRINFANTSATALYIGNVSYPSFKPVPGSFVVLGTASTATFGMGPASVTIQLYAGLTSTSLSPILIGSGANQSYVTNTASTIASAQGTFNGGSTLTLPGTDGTTPIFLQMVLTAINGNGHGISPIIQVIPSLSPAPATPVFGPPGTPNVWTTSDDWVHYIGIGLRIGAPVPEPSALALAASSLAVMFIARRKMR